jgi:hypothetical protein
MENWNYAHPASLGMTAQEYPYNFQLGAGHNHFDDRIPGLTISDTGPSEENQRARLHRWLEFMEAGSWADIPLPSKKNAASSKNGASKRNGAAKRTETAPSS